MYDFRFAIVQVLLFISLHRFRFVSKGRKWYGWTAEEADEEWDKAVRDPQIKKRKDEFGELTVAKLLTTSDNSGIRIGNKRSISQKNQFQAEDQEAINDARDSSILNYPLVCEILVKRLVFI